MAVFFCVFLPQALPVEKTGFVSIAGAALVFGERFRIIVGVNEAVVAGVVRRVDVNHLHLAVIAFLQDAQHLQVFALDEHVRRLRRVAGAGQQGVAGGLLDFAAGGSLARPAQFVMLLRGGRIGLVRLQQLLQAADVDLPVADDFRRGLPQQRREGAGALFQRIGAEARRGACVRLLAVGCWLFIL